MPSPSLNPVKVKFWGTRGSIPKPSRSRLRYGGNTSCVQLLSPQGTLLLLDCGSGAHDLGQSLMAAGQGSIDGHILISHTHWDHIQGFPFFGPLFSPEGKWSIYGPSSVDRTLQETLAGQMEHSYFPISLEEMGANIRFHELGEGEFDINDIHITARYLNHPVLTFGYRLEMGSATVVYVCDHEPHTAAPEHWSGDLHELDRRHSEFLSGADLVIHDAQYTTEEYVKYHGWGHSPIEYVVKICELSQVKQLALTHHDPSRTDDELDKIVAKIRRDLELKHSPLRVFAAAEGREVELDSGQHIARTRPTDTVPAELLFAHSAAKETTILIAVSDASLAHLLEESIQGNGIHVMQAPTGDTARQVAQSASPSIMVLENRKEGIDGLKICQELRASDNPQLREMPVILVADKEEAEQGKISGVTGWLITPFSRQYAQAKIQAGLMRATNRWVRAEVPPDENKRLAALQSVGILDTEPNERFDRLTRVAAALGNAPVALISLVDENRQWFKSCVGLDETETSREVSFCAHAVEARKSLIITDTWQDDRFADNPLVVSAPHIRFYAGFPIFHESQNCLGTLCLIDFRARQFAPDLIERFEDLAKLVEREINLGHSVPPFKF